jgi:hypothetical protein
MLTAADLISQAAQDAKAPLFLNQGLLKLNTILDELCFKHSFSGARTDYDFTLAPFTTTVAGITNFGGPYLLPLDYLRGSESHGTEGIQYAFWYVYMGVPYPLRPWDLGKLDMMVQQAGIQTFPYGYATDMATETTAADRFRGTTTASMNLGDRIINVGANTGMLIGQGVAGQGIAPGTLITSITGTVIGVSLPTVGSFPFPSGPGSASIRYGICPRLYVYPGPANSFPARYRYQRLMPPIQDTGVIPWFTDQGYLLERLTAELMVTTDDTRRKEMLMISRERLGHYEIFEGDKTNRAQTVLLDNNRFGPGSNWGKLNNTKLIGW